MRTLAKRAAGIALREVLPKARVFGGDGDVRVTACTSDARRCRPGDLFIALVGAENDGHDEARLAVKRGAAAVLSEQPILLGAPVFVVNDAREAYGRVCQAIAGRPAESLKVIAVSGSRGKTVTAQLLAGVFAAAGGTVGSATSLGAHDGCDLQDFDASTPSPPALADAIARMAAAGCTHAVLELSSQALAERRAAGIEWDAAVLTNIGREHIGRHGSMLNYRRAKERLFRQLSPRGFAVVNADDRTSRRIMRRIERPLLTHGIVEDADITATVIERHAGEQTFLLHAGDVTIPVCTAMIGDHHVHNCLAAAAAGLAGGLELPEIVRGLESVRRIPGRLERIECGQPFGMFVEAAATPMALIASLRALRPITRGRLICVYSADSQGDPDDRPLLGRAVERGADWGIITSTDIADEDSLPTAHDIIDGYARPARAHVLPSRPQAIELAVSSAEEGDTVLICGGECASRHAGVDAAFARHLLYEGAGSTPAVDAYDEARGTAAACCN